MADFCGSTVPFLLPEIPITEEFLKILTLKKVLFSGFRRRSFQMHPLYWMSVYWGSGTSIYKKGPLSHDKVCLIGTLPNEIVKNRTPYRLATDLTFSANHRHLSVDPQIGRQWFIGDMDIETGQYTVWQEYDRCYNHAQFSPADNDQQLVAQDWWHDCVTGEETYFENRIWLIRKGHKAVPVFEGKQNQLCHEWWSDDGKEIMYIHYGKGTFSYHLETGENELIWPGTPCHSHCSSDKQMFVGDVNVYSWDRDPCKILFFDRKNQKEISIVSDMKKPVYFRDWYHTDPHPRFISNDEAIIYTTTELGDFTLAITFVSDILT